MEEEYQEFEMRPVHEDDGTFVPDNCTSDWWVYQKAIPKETCDKIIEFPKDKWEKASVGGDNIEPEDGFVIEEIRKSDVVWCDEKDVYEMAWSYVQNANEHAKWKFQLDSVQCMQITRYKEGDFYDFHIDGNGTTREMKDRKSTTYGKTRKLSMTIVLNDDYEGGEFEFLSMGGQLIKEKMGTVIVFPSYIQHRVRPVTKGTRYSLVVWFCGEPFI